MNKSDKPGGRDTQVIPGADKYGDRGAADTDQMMTVVRHVVVGRLVVVGGPGKGTVIDLHKGTNSIGRDPKLNVIGINFGDDTISRKEHAFISYSSSGFRVADNGKPNPIKINGEVLTGDRAVEHNDVIEIGVTMLRLEKA